MSNTIKESELAALAAGKTIAKLRAIDNDGDSISVTPAQAATAIAEPLATPLAPILAPIIAPMLGIDYSILAEQAMPGECWIGGDGKRRQVYTRTFQGANSPTAFPYSIPGQLYPYAWSFTQIGAIFDCRLTYVSIGGSDFINPATGEPNFIWRGFDLWFKESVNAKFNSLNYVLTLKYTKP